MDEHEHHQVLLTEHINRQVTIIGIIAMQLCHLR